MYVVIRETVHRSITRYGRRGALPLCRIRNATRPCINDRKAKTMKKENVAVSSLLRLRLMLKSPPELLPPLRADAPVASKVMPTMLFSIRDNRWGFRTKWDLEIRVREYFIIFH
jgi:hypothetical protein